jgi:hypothetical protein
MTMEVDFPAAHSMDSIWFAVDEDGHVAGLCSNGAGAAPAGRPHLLGEDQERLCARLQELLPDCPVTYDLAGRMTPGPLHRTDNNHWAADMSHPGATLVFLRSLDLVAQEIALGNAVQYPATEGWAVRFTSLPPDLARKIHEAGACLGCFHHSTWTEHSDLAHRGLFSYEQLLGDWFPGPYGRQRSPNNPVHIDQLPAELREIIGQVRFAGLCFAQTVHLQPAEYLACDAMNAGYLTADGQSVRPFPGQESGYRQFYADFLREAPAEAVKRLRIERPSRQGRKRG